MFPTRWADGLGTCKTQKADSSVRQRQHLAKHSRGCNLTFRMFDTHPNQYTRSIAQFLTYMQSFSPRLCCWESRGRPPARSSSSIKESRSSCGDILTVWIHSAWMIYSSCSCDVKLQTVLENIEAGTKLTEHLFDQRYLFKIWKTWRAHCWKGPSLSMRTSVVFMREHGRGRGRRTLNITDGLRLFITVETKVTQRRLVRCLGLFACYCLGDFY